jgi:hypothetical protein
LPNWRAIADTGPSKGGHLSILETAYKTLTVSAKRDLKGKAVSDALTELIGLSLRFLADDCIRIPLQSRVPAKTYFAFRPRAYPTDAGQAKMSRPVNASLFDADVAQRHLTRMAQADLSGLDPETRRRALYSAAMSYCGATDLLKKDDKGTPGKFFENFIGHLVAATFGLNPTRSIEVLNLDMKTRLPTDYVFDFGPGQNKIHLPVKTSTRERVVQVWAHQRVLDGVYGVNRFKGLLVCLTETNAQKPDSVVETCLPAQWAIYQMFIAQLHRVYYFDPPADYAALAKTYPFIQVKSFADFFDEAGQLTTSAPLA